MNRLRDEAPGGTPGQALAQRLVRAARPLEASTALKREVRRSLPSRPRSASFALRTALAAAAMVALFGAASAMTARWWQARRHAQAPHDTTRATPLAARAPESSPPRTPAAPPPPCPAPVPSRSSSSPARATPRLATPRPLAPADVRVPSPSAAPSDQLTLYLDGIEALRRRHDPAAAAHLLARYRDAYPNGDFVEDSYALSMEAASSLGETPRDLAAAYLARFPEGRYRRLAAQALAP